MRLAMLVIGIIGCCTHCLGPARAETKVTPELVCTVQDAIRWRASAWDSQRCEQVAAALAATPEPDTMAAICVLESDLRPGVVAYHRVPGRDGSASAPRAAGRTGGATFYKIAHPGPGRAGARLWAASAGATRHSKLVADAGLCGVRCVLGPGQRCTNWPVRGMTVEQLKDPKTNIAAAARILAKKQRTCGAKAHDCYVGDPDGSKGRSGDVRAILAAFSGVELQVKKARVRELVKKIAAAVRRERQS